MFVIPGSRSEAIKSILEKAPEYQWFRGIMKAFSPTERGLFKHIGPPPPCREQEDGSSMDSKNEKKTILVVDGDPEVLRFVSGVLVDSNYNVLGAGSGSLGLEQSRKFKSEIHLLLSDFALS